MITRALNRVGRVARRMLDGRAPAGGAILLYHRIADVRPDPLLLCVTPAHFAEHLEVLRKFGRPTTLRTLAADVRDRHDIAQKPLVVSFDDGYADNLLAAKPLLETHDVPATVFVAVDQVTRNDEFWWDELERLLLHEYTLPGDLHLTVNGTDFQWRRDDFVGGIASDHARASWSVLESGDPSPEHTAYRALFDLLKPARDDERRRVLRSLQSSVGAPAKCRSSHRALNSVEVGRLQEGGLVEVGAHTMTHPVLAALPTSGQRDEIVNSKAGLDDMLGRSTSSFAYPYGTRSDYTPETVALVREAGFSIACSNFCGIVSSRTDAFQLPRSVVRDWDGDEFEKHLRSWFAA